MNAERYFLETSGNIDRFGCKIFVKYTNSSVGGILIETIILDGEFTSIITEGLELWKKIFSPGHSLVEVKKDQNYLSLMIQLPNEVYY